MARSDTSLSELPHIRKLFQDSVTEEKKAHTLWKLLSSYKGDEPVIIAYMAGAKAMLARYHWSPYRKLQFLTESMQWFKKAVKGSPPNIEIRFLRFAVQHHMPGFLGLETSMERDKQIILTNIPYFSRFNLSKEEAHKIAEFVWSSGRCTEEEEIRLKSLFLPEEPQATN